MSHPLNSGGNHLWETDHPKRVGCRGSERTRKGGELTQRRQHKCPRHELQLPNNPRWVLILAPHFTGEKTEDQQG